MIYLCLYLRVCLVRAITQVSNVRLTTKFVCSCTDVSATVSVYRYRCVCVGRYSCELLAATAFLCAQQASYLPLETLEMQFVSTGSVIGE